MHTEFCVLTGEKRVFNSVTSTYPNGFSSGGRFFDRITVFYMKDGVSTSKDLSAEHCGTTYLGGGNACFSFYADLSLDGSVTVTSFSFKTEAGELVNTAEASFLLGAGYHRIAAKAYVNVSGVELNAKPEGFFEYLFGIGKHALKACVTNGERVYCDDGTALHVERSRGKIVLTAVPPEGKDGKYTSFFCDKECVFSVEAKLVRVESRTEAPRSYTLLIEGESEIIEVAGSADNVSDVAEYKVPTELGEGVLLPLPFYCVGACGKIGEELLLRHKHGVVPMACEGGEYRPTAFLSNSFLVEGIRDCYVKDSVASILTDRLILANTTTGNTVATHDVSGGYSRVFGLSDGRIILAGNSGFCVFKVASELEEEWKTDIFGGRYIFDSDTDTLTAITSDKVYQYTFSGGDISELAVAFSVADKAHVGGRRGRITVAEGGKIQSKNLINGEERTFEVAGDVSRVSENGSILAARSGNGYTVYCFTGEEIREIGRIVTDENLIVTNGFALTEGGVLYPFCGGATLVDVLAKTLPDTLTFYSETPYFAGESVIFSFEATI